VRWISDLEQDLLPCPACQAPLRANPFRTSSCLPLPLLGSVRELPLAAWGVPPQAVIEVQHGRRAQAYVIGPRNS
jgi:hypothetical protein